MNYSRQGLALTESFEGVRLTAYQDSTGRWTIGYGHTFCVLKGQTCTQQDAEAWLISDVAWAEKAVNRLVTSPLSQGEYDALVDFTFNLGVGSLQHSTLLHLVDARMYEEAAQEFEKWDYAGGVIVAGLMRRRLAEAQEFNS